MLHATFSRKGGKARSPAKTAANRKKAAAFWKSVRAGKLPPPRRHRAPPSLEEIRLRLAAYCRRNDIVRLEVFGSVARDEARRGSDVDLIATFAANPGLRFFGMENEMARILGVPVHLLSHDSLAEMTNPYRRASIRTDAREVFHA